MTRNRAPAAEADALDPASLFRRLAGRRGLILAVSGGPDSTALMLLASRWRERPPVLVVTIDHGLRPEAATEARLVADNAERLTLPWRIMQAGARERGNLQDWARRARYRYFVEAARDASLDTIVTAHHQDDQAETFLLRLARGSGVYGLAAMREAEELDGLLLARPLLGVSRASLGKIAAASGLQTVADPSNTDLRFDRVRMRALMPDLAEHGLDAVRLAETAGRLARAAEALDHYAGEFLKTHFEADRFGVVSGSASSLGGVPEEIALRALARILKAVGGADYTPPLAAIESLRDGILAISMGKSLKRTLSGVVVAVADGRVTAVREWGRSGLTDTDAPAGATLLWDGRFRVEIPPLAGPLSVGALGWSERRLRSGVVRQNALRTLPGLYQAGILIAAPGNVLAPEKQERIDILAVECIVGQRLGLPAAKPPAP